MTAVEQQILKELGSIKRELIQLKKEKVKSDKEYITAEEVEELVGISKETLKKYRSDHRLTDYTSVSGKNFRYSKEEILRVFVRKSKLS